MTHMWIVVLVLPRLSCKWSHFATITTLHIFVLCKDWRMLHWCQKQLTTHFFCEGTPFLAVMHRSFVCFLDIVLFTLTWISTIFSPLCTDFAPLSLLLLRHVVLSVHRSFIVLFVSYRLFVRFFSFFDTDYFILTWIPPLLKTSWGHKKHGLSRNWYACKVNTFVGT